MRDPECTSWTDEGFFYRKFKSETDSSVKFFKNAETSAMTEIGFLPIEFTSSLTSRTNLIENLSYPFEWTPLQLFRAANLTLDIQDHLLRSDLELKDASVWNVIFSGNEPKFCDHGSITKLEGSNWWAFGQFVSNFLFPLLLFNKLGVTPREIFCVNRDGINASQLQKYNITFYKCSPLFWPLLFSGKLVTTTHFNGGRQHNATNVKKRLSVVNYLRNALQSVAPLIRNDTTWHDYEHNRSHYSIADLEIKKKFVKGFLNTQKEKGKQKQVIDLGCNAGEFLNEVRDGFVTHVGVDFDINALSIVQKKYPWIQTFHIDFDNFAQAKGAMGAEYLNFEERVKKSDLCLFLAITHHLEITHSIPLQEILSFVSKTTSAFVIFEAIYHTDPMAKRLASNRSRDISFLDRDYFTSKFDKLFKTLKTVKLSENNRELFLLKKNEH